MIEKVQQWEALAAEHDVSTPQRLPTSRQSVHFDHASLNTVPAYRRAVTSNFAACL